MFKFVEKFLSVNHVTVFFIIELIFQSKWLEVFQLMLPSLLLFFFLLCNFHQFLSVLIHVASMFFGWFLLLIWLPRFLALWRTRNALTLTALATATAKFTTATTLFLLVVWKSYLAARRYVFWQFSPINPNYEIIILLNHLANLLNISWLNIAVDCFQILVKNVNISSIVNVFVSHVCYNNFMHFKIAVVEDFLLN